MTGKKTWRVNDHGYVAIWMPNYAGSRKNGYILEHRYVMEKHLGRLLRPKEVVHHLNEIKTDNRIENLELTDISAHVKEHDFLRINKSRPHLYSGKKCKFRNCSSIGGHRSKLCRKHYQTMFWRKKYGKK